MCDTIPSRLLFNNAGSSVVNSGCYRRYRGAEWPKMTKRDAALQGGAFGESGWSGRYSVEQGGQIRVKATVIHLKPFFRVKIVRSEQLDLSLRGSNCTLHPFSRLREEEWEEIKEIFYCTVKKLRRSEWKEIVYAAAPCTKLGLGFIC